MNQFTPLNRKRPSFWQCYSDDIGFFLWGIVTVLAGINLLFLFDKVESWLR